MTLGHLDEVFRFCTSDFASCPVFRASGGGAVAIDGGAIDADVVTDGSDIVRAARDRFRFCDGPIADDVARFADACIERIAEFTSEIGVELRANPFVELTIERAPLGRSVVA
ncbi:MAG: hypothetical protein ACKO3W_12480 [bacterium]